MKINMLNWRIMSEKQTGILVDVLRDPQRLEEFSGYFEVCCPDQKEFVNYNLQKKAKDHIIFILMVFMRFSDTVKASIDKFLFLDILRFLPTGSFLHFKDITICGLSTEKLFFNFSTFKNVYFEKCHLCRAFFKNAVIKDCQFKLCCIEEGNFSDSNITNTTFCKVNLTLSLFSSAVLKKVTFEQSYMEKINFDTYMVNQERKTLLQNCNFRRCEMSYAWFTKDVKMLNNTFFVSNLCYAKFGPGIYNISNCLEGCGTMGLDVPSGLVIPNPGEVCEVDWIDDISEQWIWYFGGEAHLPYTPYCHDNVMAPGFYLGEPEFRPLPNVHE